MQTFPDILHRENAMLFELMGQTITGGQTASGVIPVTRTDAGGLWKATLADVFLHTPEQVRTWRAIAGICDGGATPIIVPMCDKRFYPAPIVSGRRITTLPVPHSDDSPHSDGSPYDSMIVQAEIGAAALRATTVTISIFTGEPLQGGEHFSIEHDGAMSHRLYRIVSVATTGAGSVCEIRPPLRAAVEDGDALDFDHPRCVMRLATPDAMDLLLEQRKFGKPTVSFLEAFPPYPAGT